MRIRYKGKRYRVDSINLWFVVGTALLPVVTVSVLRVVWSGESFDWLDHLSFLGMAAGPVATFFLPCNDPTFGNGRPLFFVRQLTFGAAAIYISVVAFL